MTQQGLSLLALKTNWNWFQPAMRGAVCKPEFPCVRRVFFYASLAPERGRSWFRNPPEAVDMERIVPSFFWVEKLHSELPSWISTNQRYVHPAGKAPAPFHNEKGSMVACFLTAPTVSKLESN